MIGNEGFKGGIHLILLKKRESSEESHVKLIAYTIILYISSLFAPLVIVSSYQSMVYYSKEQWFFTTPFSAYITFMIGMLFIAMVLTIYLIFREKWNQKLLNWTTGVLILITFPAFILSLTDYYYLDQKGIHYNGLLELKENEYKWTNVSKVHIIYRNHQGTTGFYQYKFEMKNKKMIAIPVNDKLLNNNLENKRRVEEVIRKNNIPVTDNFKNPIVD
jgi:hypothetical protein